MRTVASIDISAPPQRGVASDLRPGDLPARHGRASPAGRSTASSASGVGARATGCSCAWARPTSAGSMEIVEWEEPRELAWTSVTGVDQRGRWRLREHGTASRPRHTRVELRLSYGVAGSGIAGWLAEHLAARHGGRPYANLHAPAQATRGARAAPRRRGGPPRGPRSTLSATADRRTAHWWPPPEIRAGSCGRRSPPDTTRRPVTCQRHTPGSPCGASRRRRPPATARISVDDH